MNITLHANRHTSRTFDSLKTFWIWPRLYDLDPNKPRHFLSRFLSLVDLGSFIDSEALADYVTRIPLVGRDRPSAFMRESKGESKGGYVIAELVTFLRGTESWSIHAGAMFTQYAVAAFIVWSLTSRNSTRFSSYILVKKIPAELTILCRLLEIVAGSVIMAGALTRKGSLHGVTLPRSWILENVQKFHRVQNKDVNFRVVWDILTSFRDLRVLESVFSGSDADIGEFIIRKLRFSYSPGSVLHHQNKPLHSVPFRTKNLALARLYVLVALTLERSSLTLHIFPRCRIICLRELLLVLWRNSTAFLIMQISGVQY